MPITLNVLEIEAERHDTWITLFEDAVPKSRFSPVLTGSGNIGLNTSKNRQRRRTENYSFTLTLPTAVSASVRSLGSLPEGR
jgi:hypothetical protein